METPEMRRSTLQRKDRDELVEIATTMGKKPPSRARKGEIVEIILPDGGVFEYAEDFTNGTFFPQKGTLLGFAGQERREVRTPVDDCYFIMPVHFRLDGGSCGRFAREIRT